MNKMNLNQKGDIEKLSNLLIDMSTRGATDIELIRVVTILENVIKYRLRINTSETLCGLGDLIKKYQQK